MNKATFGSLIGLSSVSNTAMGIKSGKLRADNRPNINMQNRNQSEIVRQPSRIMSQRDQSQQQEEIIWLKFKKMDQAERTRLLEDNKYVHVHINTCCHTPLGRQNKCAFHSFYCKWLEVRFVPCPIPLPCWKDCCRPRADDHSGLLVPKNYTVEGVIKEIEVRRSCCWVPFGRCCNFFSSNDCNILWLHGNQRLVEKNHAEHVFTNGSNGKNGDSTIENAISGISSDPKNELYLTAMVWRDCFFPLLLLILSAVLGSVVYPNLHNGEFVMVVTTVTGLVFLFTLALEQCN